MFLGSAPDPGSSGQDFPAFDTFSKDKSSVPFELKLPEPVLEPERFAINEEARNFPKEAVDRNIAEPASARRKRQAEEAESRDTTSYLKVYSDYLHLVVWKSGRQCDQMTSFNSTFGH